MKEQSVIQNNNAKNREELDKKLNESFDILEKKREEVQKAKLGKIIAISCTGLAIGVIIMIFLLHSMKV